WLLAAIHVPRADDDIGGGVARAPLARRAIYGAILRADAAAAQQIPGLFGTARKLAGFKQVEITRLYRGLYTGSQLRPPGTASSAASCIRAFRIAWRSTRRRLQRSPSRSITCVRSCSLAARMRALESFTARSSHSSGQIGRASCRERV